MAVSKRTRDARPFREGVSRPETWQGMFADRVQPVGDCLIFIGSKGRGGYGQVWWRAHDTMHKAHRVSLALSRGVGVDELEVVRHSCDTPACVNPEHLVAGTQAENLADMRRKARHARGEMQPRATLTEEVVREMRRSPLGPAALGRRYGVHPATVRSALSGKSWAWVT